MIQTTDFSLYYEAMSKFGEQASGPEALNSMLDALGVLLVETQSRIPVATGALQDDANSKIIDFSPGDHITGGVSMMKGGVQKAYAWMREEGGTIVPKPNNPTGRLWFKNDSGQLISVKQVTQTGSHYMSGGLESAKSAIIDIFAQTITRAYTSFD